MRSADKDHSPAGLCPASEFASKLGAQRLSSTCKAVSVLLRLLRLLTFSSSEELLIKHRTCQTPNRSEPLSAGMSASADGGRASDRHSVARGVPTGCAAVSTCVKSVASADPWPIKTGECPTRARGHMALAGLWLGEEPGTSGALWQQPGGSTGTSDSSLSDDNSHLAPPPC